MLSDEEKNRVALALMLPDEDEISAEPPLDPALVDRLTAQAAKELGSNHNQTSLAPVIDLTSRLTNKRQEQSPPAEPGPPITKRTYVPSKKRVLQGGISAFILAAACMLVYLFGPTGSTLPPYSISINSDRLHLAAQPPTQRPALLSLSSQLVVQIQPSGSTRGKVDVIGYRAGLGKRLQRWEKADRQLMDDAPYTLTGNVRELDFEVGRWELVFVLSRSRRAPTLEEVEDVILRRKEAQNWQWRLVSIPVDITVQP